MKNFEARNGNFETSAVVKNHRMKQREQRILGDCWQRKANGQCSKGDNCSFRHYTNKRAKSTQPNPSPSSSTRQNEKNASRTRSPRGRSPSGENGSTAVARIASKELAQLHSVKKWHPPECLFYKSENGCKFVDKCVAYFKIWSRRSLHRFCGGAQTY